MCYTCLLLRGKKVNSNLCTFPRSWNDCLQRSPERRGRSTLTSTYIEDASNCSYNNKNKLKDMVKKLLAEAASQEHYGSLIKNLSDKIPAKSFIIAVGETVPSPDNFLTKAADLFEINKTFRGSILVGFFWKI